MRRAVGVSPISASPPADVAARGLLLVGADGRVQAADATAARLLRVRHGRDVVHVHVDELLLPVTTSGDRSHRASRLDPGVATSMWAVGGDRARAGVSVTAGGPRPDGTRVLTLRDDGARDGGDDLASPPGRLRDREVATLLRHVAVTIVTFDVRATITSCEGDGAGVGAGEPAAAGRSVTDVYGWLPDLRWGLQHVLAGGAVAFQASRDDRVWDVRVGPVIDADGVVEGGVAVAMDVTASVRHRDELEAGERRFRLLSEHSVDLALIAEPDGTLRFVSSAIRAMLGCEPEDVVGRNGFDFVHPDDDERVRDAYRRAVADPSARAVVEFRLRHTDGRWRWVEQVYLNLLDDPAIRAMASNLRDITERKRSEEARAATDERYRTIVESAQEGIWLVDTTYRTTFANPRMEELLGVDPGGLVGQHMLSFFFPEDRRRVAGRQTERRAETHRSDDVRYRRTDGSELWAIVVSSPVLDASGEVTGFVGMVTDITQRRADALRMERWALHDDLTGCATRRHFEQQLTTAVEAGPESLVVLMVGLDDMKDVNETAGYVVGDAVLREVGRRLRDDVGATLAARTSGDEFLLLLRSDGPVDVMVAAQRVRQELARPMTVGGHQVATACSVGAAPPRGASTAGDLLRDAEVALHEAKRMGKGCAVAFDERMRTAVAERVAVEAGLRRALVEGQLEVHYQPIHCLVTGRLAGCEALVRWRHPERGLLDPATFIPVAERSDLIVGIGTVVLREACRRGAGWVTMAGSDPPFRVGVNVAARQIADPGLLDAVRTAIAESGIDPQALCLEVTESVVMEHPERAAEVLRSLRELGVRVAIDDFGTGHSSLGSLRRFPIDVLKIDRSFVAGLGVCPEDRAVVDAIVALAHVLGFSVVAEGVETGAQLEQLVEAGCDRGQGYHWSRPVSASRLTRIVRDHVRAGPACGAGAPARHRG